MKLTSDCPCRTKLSTRKFALFLILFINLIAPISSYFKIITLDESETSPQIFSQDGQDSTLKPAKKTNSYKSYKPRDIIFTFSKGFNKQQKFIKISEKEFLTKAGITKEQMLDFYKINKILSILNKNKKQLTKFKKIIKKNLRRHLDYDVLLKENETNSQTTSFEIIQWKLEFPEQTSKSNVHSFERGAPKKVEKKMFLFPNFKNKESTKMEKSLSPFIENHSLETNQQHEKVLMGTVDKTISTNDCQFVLPFIDPRDKNIRSFESFQNLMNNTPQQIKSLNASGKDKI
jgi:hypothetical protein